MRQPPILRNLLLWLGAVLALVGDGRAAQTKAFLPQLAAVSFSATEVHPGGTLRVSLEWVNVGTSPAEGEDVVFVHLRPAVPGDPDIKPATGGDFRPATPTFAWLPRVVVCDRDRPIKIPADFPPGRYRVLIGLYSQVSGWRRRLANDDLAAPGLRYRIATVEVVPQGKPLSARPLELRLHDTRGLPQGVEPAAAPPGKAVVLDSGKLRVALGADYPVVLGYQLPDGSKLRGDCSGYPLRVRIGRVRSDRYRTLCLRDPTAFSLRYGPAEARYTVQVRDQGAQAGSFDLVFRVEGNVLRAGIESLREEPGYYLMDVCTPQLVATQAPRGQLVVPTQSGRLVHLDRSAPACHVIGMNWWEADLCGAVVGDGVAAAIRTRDWDNELEARVIGPAGRLAAGYAVRLALRAEASGPAARIRLAETPSVEVAILGRPEPTPGARSDRPRHAPNAPHAPGWVDAAKWLRRGISGSPNPLYRDTYIYKIFCDTPRARDYTTFAEALSVIRRVHQLAPWLKQVVYLVGWQYRGHDTGYPATDRINQRLGGIEGLRKLAAEAAEYNAILSYHDNFDDAYRDSPRWDESIIARDRQGNLQKGGVWAGGQSYIIAFKKYAEKAALVRVRRTVSQMPVRASYHLDVLSAVPMRRDYNPQRPESTQDSLQGKLAIIRQFNRLGIDVTSEGFTAPFVGAIGHSWHLWRNDDPVFAGEEPIPFIPMIYHGGPTTYGRGNPNAAYARQSCLYGASYSTDWTKHTTLAQMAEPIYLVVAPWTYLRDRKMRDYQRQGDLCRVTYAADTFVEVNRATGQWRLVVDGQRVIENGLAVVRKGDLLAVYAQTSRQATIALPDPLRGKKLKIANAFTGADVTPQAQLTATAVTLELPAKEPLLIRPARAP